jgi:hypothetical protein
MWKKPKIIIIKINDLREYLSFCASGGNSLPFPASIKLPNLFN